MNHVLEWQLSTVYFLEKLQKCLRSTEKPFQRVRCVGYWPSVRSIWLDIGRVFFFACLWAETESRSINSQKWTRPISNHLDRRSLVNNKLVPWVNKGFIIGLSRNSSRGTQRVVPSGQDSSILPARVANHSAGFYSSCPLTEQAI